MQGSTREDEAIARVIVRAECLCKFGLGVLHTVALIYDEIGLFMLYNEEGALTNDHMNPFHFAQNRPILDDVFISCE